MTETANLSQPATAQPAPAQGTPAPASTEESTLLGTKEAGTTDGDENTLLGETAAKSKEGEQGKSQSVVPEKYEFKAPEGMTLDQAGVDAFSPVFKEIGLSQEQAQKLVDAYTPYQKQQAEAQRQAGIDYFKNIVKEWKAETIKELGAEHPKQVAIAAKAIDKANIPGLRELMEETGVGNHPAMVKFMIWAGKLVSQDNFPDSGHKQTAPTTFEEKAKILYS